MVANTVLGSDNLYRACLEVAVARFVLVSSFSVIGTAALPRGSVVQENVPMEPYPERRGAYAFSKHRHEILAWRYAKDNSLPLVVVRPGVILARTKTCSVRGWASQCSGRFSTAEAGIKSLSPSWRTVPMPLRWQGSSPVSSTSCFAWWTTIYPQVGIWFGGIGGKSRDYGRRPFPTASCDAWRL